MPSRQQPDQSPDANVPAADAFNPVGGRAIFLTGPTASGKSAVGLQLAELINAEILSLDSMAVYRGMDVGTAKPSVAERDRVPHHLIDLVAPSEEFSLGQYIAAAHQAMHDISSRGKRSLFVGGTPLYLTGLLRGVDSGPPPDWEFREHWQSIAEEQGKEAVHARLAEIDPPSAKRLNPNDLKRVIRAMEVHKITGRPISDTPAHFAQPVPREDCRVYWLNWPTDELNPRINSRVESMLESGWREEVRILAAAGPLGRTASQAVGYRQLLETLNSQQDSNSLIADIQTATRRFAKRQRTWLRSLSECRVVEMNANRDVAEVAAEIAEDIGGFAAVQ